MSGDTLTVKDVEELRDRILAMHVTPPILLAHPDERDHLERHGGGRVDCDTCIAIWMGLEARGQV